jgi:hypothetical protein
MIDSGVYSEASIAFLYHTPLCSVCGRDLRECSHWPGREYDSELCFFWYDGVERVTEGSLVYRGAANGTGFELDKGSDFKAENEFHTESSVIENDFDREMKIKLKGKFYIAFLKESA